MFAEKKKEKDRKVLVQQIKALKEQKTILNELVGNKLEKEQEKIVEVRQF